MCSGAYDFFRDQGSIIAGIIALAAGIIAYRAALRAAKMQVTADQRRDEREVDALRRSLATELRQLIPQALKAHNLLKGLVTSATKERPLTARMVENSTRLPAAVVYPSSAPKIGLLGGSDAMNIVIIYNLIELARQGAEERMRSRTPDNISPRTVAAVADAFLKACQYAAQEVLPKFPTGIALHESADNDLIKRITEAVTAWDKILQDWPRQ